MRVRFEATLDDFVDVGLRLHRRSKVARRSNWQSAIATGFLVGFALFGIITEPIPLKVACGASGALVGSVLSFVLYQWELRRRLSQYYREQLGTEGPVGVTAELTPEGMRTDQMGTQLSVDWANVEAINDLPDGIEFLVRGGGIVVVRRRAFPSTHESQRFLELASQYRNRSNGQAERPSDA